MDHATGLIHVEYQLSLGSVGTMVANKAFECMALTHAMAIQ